MHPSSPKIVPKASPRTSWTLKMCGFPLGKPSSGAIPIFRPNSPKSAPRRLSGAPFCLLGPSWAHFGPNLVPTGPHSAPSWRIQVPFGRPKLARKPPRVTPESAKARQKAPKVTQASPRTLFCEILDPLGPHFEGLWLFFGAPWGARSGSRPLAENSADPLAGTSSSI